MIVMQPQFICRQHRFKGSFFLTSIFQFRIKPFQTFQCRRRSNLHFTFHLLLSKMERFMLQTIKMARPLLWFVIHMEELLKSLFLLLIINSLKDERFWVILLPMQSVSIQRWQRDCPELTSMAIPLWSSHVILLEVKWRLLLRRHWKV